MLRGDFDPRIELSIVQSQALTFNPMLVKKCHKASTLSQRKACNASYKKVSSLVSKCVNNSEKNKNCGLSERGCNNPLMSFPFKERISTELFVNGMAGS